MSTEVTIQPLSADLTAALSLPLKEQDIKVRPGAKGMTLKYISGKTAIEHANALFGIGKWGYQVIARSHEVMHDATKGTNVEYYTCDIELLVSGCEFSFPGDGMGIVLYPTPEGHEKARKEATTDALKRALRHFGPQFGLSLYDEDDYIEGLDGEPKQVKEVVRTTNKLQSTRVVEAGAGTRQPLKDKQVVQFQTRNHEELPNRERLNNLFEAGKAGKLWRTRQTMMDRMSLVLDTQITDSNIGELTDSLLDLVEEDIQNPKTF